MLRDEPWSAVTRSEKLTSVKKGCAPASARCSGHLPTPSRLHTHAPVQILPSLKTLMDTRIGRANGRLALYEALSGWQHSRRQPSVLKGWSAGLPVEVLVAEGLVRELQPSRTLFPFVTRQNPKQLLLHIVWRSRWIWILRFLIVLRSLFCGLLQATYDEATSTKHLRRQLEHNIHSTQKANVSLAEKGIS